MPKTRDQLTPDEPDDLAALDRSRGQGTGGTGYDLLPEEERAGPAPSSVTIRAVWNDAILAESDDTVVVEGNHYFPRRALRAEHFEPVDDTSFCPWKGTASYYDVVVDGRRNSGAAWYYPDPMDAAAEIKDRVAFWKGVEVASLR